MVCFLKCFQTWCQWHYGKINDAMNVIAAIFVACNLSFNGVERQFVKKALHSVTRALHAIATQFCSLRSNKTKMMQDAWILQCKKAFTCTSIMRMSHEDKLLPFIWKLLSSALCSVFSTFWDVEFRASNLAALGRVQCIFKLFYLKRHDVYVSVHT